MTDRYASTAGGGMIDFAERLANSETFSTLFRDGMGLVEETAAYLDGEGRVESKSLPRAALACLRHRIHAPHHPPHADGFLASAPARGERGRDDARAQAGSEKTKVRLDSASPNLGSPGFDELPEMLRSLIERSVRLQERILHLDRMIQDSRRQEEAVSARNPVAAHLNALNAAFGAGRFDG